MALLALTACTAAAPPEAEQPGPAFDPVAFFTGATRGDGKLDQIMKGVRTVTVDSVGELEANGALTLTQRIAMQGDPPRTRVWKLKQVAPGRYAGNLTDATGSVETVAIGRAIRIRYPMKGGLMVEQWLVALPGGRKLDNRLTVTKWGMRVASLHERIEKR
ncbi:MAG: DUF3833 domain-containing protein [Sphingomonas bacterium]|nr:DUF3833 domain-containing protein [Sphingomonas bacterium]